MGQSGLGDNDIDKQNPNNYFYDKEGGLNRDAHDRIQRII